jgi:hypothetical protein
MRLEWRCFILLLWMSASHLVAQTTRPVADGAFIHPGLLHTQADLERMRKNVAAGHEPWKGGFEKLRRDAESNADWKLRGPEETVTREPRNLHGNNEMVQDGNAAYQNALMWCITGEEAHARKAVQVLNAWGSTLRTMDGHDVQLAAGLNGFKFVNAAELMRYTYPTWKAQDIARFEQMLRQAVYPPIKDFATFANGNWDAACIKTMMAIGVFCDDRAMFDRAVEYYRNGQGNGRLTHYVFAESGQCQESGRDQAHTQLGLAALADACEIAWNQGLDLYGEADDRLLKGFEYTARYNLGQDVPFVAHVDTTGTYRQKKISDIQRGEFRPVYEMVWNHYENRRGIPAPFTKQAAEKIRPEGAGQGADHPGFGTLLFFRDAEPTAKPARTDQGSEKP